MLPYREALLRNLQSFTMSIVSEAELRGTANIMFFTMSIVSEPEVCGTNKTVPRSSPKEFSVTASQLLVFRNVNGIRSRASGYDINLLKSPTLIVKPILS